MAAPVRSLFKWVALILLLDAIVPTPLQAQSQPVCDRSSDYEPPVDTVRTVELPNLGVSVSIPANYRAMQLQDGSVQILHPTDFEWIRCTAGGGASRGSGYYFDGLQKVQPELDITLEDQAIQMMGSRNYEIMPHEQNGLEGYIVRSTHGHSVFFLGTVPGVDHLIQVVAACDCEVYVDDVVEMLAQVRPLR